MTFVCRDDSGMIYLLFPNDCTLWQIRAEIVALLPSFGDTAEQVVATFDPDPIVPPDKTRIVLQVPDTIPAKRVEIHSPDG